MPDSSVRMNQLLTNISTRYSNSVYVADTIAPVVGVKKETDTHLVYGYEQFRLPYTRRGNKSEAKSASYAASSSTYNLTYHALRDWVSQRDRDNADAPQNPDMDATRNLTDLIMLRREVDCRNLMFTTTTWAQNSALVSTTSWRYNTTTSGNPAIHAHSAISILLNNSAKRPNVVLIGHPTYLNLLDNANILERLKYVTTGILGKEIIASLMDVDKMVVGEAIQTTTQEGLGNTTGAVWANNALFAYVAPAPALNAVSAAYAFTLNGKQPYSVRKYRDDPRDADTIEVETAYQYKAVATLAAYLYADVDL